MPFNKQLRVKIRDDRRVDTYFKVVGFAKALNNVKTNGCPLRGLQTTVVMQQNFIEMHF